MREELEEMFLASVEDEDILMEVDREADLFSRDELSFRNSLAEDRLLGGEDDLELAEDDFLDDAPVELLDVFLIDVVELFLVLQKVVGHPVIKPEGVQNKTYVNGVGIFIDVGNLIDRSVNMHLNQM